MFNKGNKKIGNTTLEKIVEKIKNSNNIILTGHVNPDGDALGSLLAFYFMIQEYSKKIKKEIKVQIVIDDKLPKYMKKFEDVDLIKKVENVEKTGKIDLFISLDCANIERYGKSLELKLISTESINIDHHISNTEHGDYNYVEDISSTSELIYQFIELFGIKLNKKMAEYMYLGIINDTGNFRHDNVTSNTFNVCSKLIEVGANNHKVANIIFEISLKKINLLGDVYKNKVVDEKNKFIYYYLTQEKMLELGIEKDDTDGIAEMLLKIENTELSLFMREEKDKTIKGSFRSNDKYDVNKMALKFNGGGHIKAAGFKTELSKDKIIEEVYKNL